LAANSVEIASALLQLLLALRDREYSYRNVYRSGDESMQDAAANDHIAASSAELARQGGEQQLVKQFRT
jgi:hypothetical protein